VYKPRLQSGLVHQPCRRFVLQRPHVLEACLKPRFLNTVTQANNSPDKHWQHWEQWALTVDSRLRWKYLRCMLFSVGSIYTCSCMCARTLLCTDQYATVVKNSQGNLRTNGRVPRVTGILLHCTIFILDSRSKQRKANFQRTVYLIVIYHGH